MPAKRAVPAVQRAQEPVATERGWSEHEQPVSVPEKVSVPQAPPRRWRHPRQGVHGHNSQDLQWVLHVMKSRVMPAFLHASDESERERLSPRIRQRLPTSYNYISAVMSFSGRKVTEPRESYETEFNSVNEMKSFFVWALAHMNEIEMPYWYMTHRFNKSSKKYRHFRCLSACRSGVVSNAHWACMRSGTFLHSWYSILAKSDDIMTRTTLFT